MTHRAADHAIADPTEDTGVEELEQLLTTPSGDRSTQPAPAPIDGAVLGTLVGFQDNAATPLVTYRGQQGTAAIPARATIDLYGAHIGREAVLVFEGGDPSRPIIVGCLRQVNGHSLPELAGQVEVDADGERMIVSAKEQIVLRCGKSSLTLTKAGKVMIHGAYVSNRSTGVLRLKGGSVQIN